MPSFDWYLSEMCARTAATLCSAALCIPQPHIHMAFSLYLTENLPHSPFASVFVTSETYVTDIARISRFEQAGEIRPDQHAFFSFVNILTFMAVTFY